MTETMPNESMEAPDIRKFGDAGVSAAIDSALATLPAEKRGAVVATVVQVDGVYRQRLLVVARIGDDWSVVGTLTHAGHKRVDGSAAVRWAW